MNQKVYYTSIFSNLFWKYCEVNLIFVFFQFAYDLPQWSLLIETSVIEPQGVDREWAAEIDYLSLWWIGEASNKSNYNV